MSRALKCHVVNLSGTGKAKLRYYIESEKCYYLCKENTGKCLLLRCIGRNCKCTGKLVEGNLFFRSNRSGGQAAHNHPDHQYEAEADMAYEKLKKEVIDSRRPIREMHDEMLRKLSTEAGRHLQWIKVETTLSRLRRKKFPSCTSVDDFERIMETNEEVKNAYGEYRGEAFYHGTVGPNANSRASIFVIRQHLKHLKEGFSMSGDGTFKIVPAGFMQLYVILAEFQGRPRPLAFILMTHRTRQLYICVFAFFRDGLNLIPGSFMGDFEIPSREAVRCVWANCLVFGCSFHHAQAIIRKAKKLDGLKQVFMKDKLANITFRMFLALKYLPAELIDEGLTEILNYQQENGLTKKFHTFNKYFQRTWMGMYPPSDWCVSDLRYRTNNHIEGLNHKIKTMINPNPNTYAFLESLLDLTYQAHSDSEAEYYNGMRLRQRESITKKLMKAKKDLHDGHINVRTFLILMSPPPPCFSEKDKLNKSKEKKKITKG